MIEEWKPVKDFEDYLISNFGKVKSLKFGKERMIKSGLNQKGYHYTILSKNDKKKLKTIHRLVAEAFIPNPNNKSQINHIDGNKENNCVDNLEWCTNQENQLHAWKIGLQKTTKIIQYDLKGNFIKEWDSIPMIKMSLNIDTSHIGQCCKRKRKTANGYIWKYKDIA